MSDIDETVRSRALLCAYLLTAIAVMGAASVVPALPALGEEMGVSAPMAAWVIGFFIAPAMLLTPVIGHVSDRLGLKPVVMAALILYAICAAICALASSFYILLGLRLAQGVGAAALELLALVIIAAVAGPEYMRKAMGRNASVIGVCLCIYPVVSGVLVDLEWRAVFLLGLAAAPVAYVVYTSLDSKALTTHGSAGRLDLAALWRLVRQPELRQQYALIVLLFILLFGCFFSFVPEAAARTGLDSGSLIGTIPLAMALSIAMTAPQMDRVAARIGEAGVVALAAGLYAASLLGLIYAGTYVHFLIAAALFGAGHGMLFPLTQSVLGRNAPDQGRGLFMSANAMAIAAGQTIGPFLIGFVVGQTTLEGGFMFGLVVAGLILTIGFGVRRR